MRLEIAGSGCPVLPGVRVGVQRGREVVDERPAAGGDLLWRLDLSRRGGEPSGPYVQGRPGERFVYLSWQRDGEGMFRRAKLMLDAVPAELLAGDLRADVALALPDGSPLCAAVRPPQVRWSALAARDDRDRLLEAFLDEGGQLRSIPARHAKRLVVLDHVASAFEIGVRYPEREVDAVLRAFHPDHAALRRYLVDDGFLGRGDGTYWRTGGTAPVDGG